MKRGAAGGHRAPVGEPRAHGEHVPGEQRVHGGRQDVDAPDAAPHQGCRPLIEPSQVGLELAGLDLPRADEDLAKREEVVGAEGHEKEPAARGATGINPAYDVADAGIDEAGGRIETLAAKEQHARRAEPLRFELGGRGHGFVERRRGSPTD